MKTENQFEESFVSSVVSSATSTPRRSGRTVTTPSKKSRDIVLLDSTSRGILKPAHLSPKTPNGRAGLVSPEKRATPDLNRSARKRAVSKYAELMDEFSDDELNEQERDLAEIIIKGSRNDNDFNYGSDVELEEDVSERPRRRRKMTKPISSEDESISEDEYVPRKRKRRNLFSPSPQKSPEKHIETEKKRVGRPTKAAGVIGKVKSIFHMDDEDLFVGNKKKEDTPKQEAKDILAYNFNKSSMVKVPKISGMKTEEIKPVISDSISFEPMPIPQVDEDGNIIDEEFKQKYYLHQKNPRTALIDDRAFFLEGSEGYFEQHSTRPKYSTNSLSQLAPALDYDEFIPYIQMSEFIKGSQKENLALLHKSLYDQWCFELSQGYNLNFFGVGSKRNIMLDFVQNFLLDWYDSVYEPEDDEEPSILVVNGFNPTLKFKKVLQDIVTSAISKQSDNVKYPKHVSETLPFLIKLIQKNRDSNSYSGDLIKPKLILVVHNIDGESLRDEKTQSFLSQLCSLPEVWLISSTDHVNASLLWDSVKLRNYNFIWRNLTTYEPYTTEMSFKDVLSIGKSKKYVGNKGAKYVLTSLTSNAKNLYRILLVKQIEMIKLRASATMGQRGNAKYAIAFADLYEACVEQFITSNEISFRTMLREFIEHKMCTLSKNESGTEMVFVPFSFEEMEQLLVDLKEI